MLLLYTQKDREKREKKIDFGNKFHFFHSPSSSSSSPSLGFPSHLLPSLYLHFTFTKVRSFFSLFFPISISCFLYFSIPSVSRFFAMFHCPFSTFYLMGLFLFYILIPLFSKCSQCLQIYVEFPVNF